ncbi:MAG: YbaN family protein [Pseudobdellovibrio sp.]
MSRPFYLVLGFLSLGVGILGAFLPVLPTTCFILLSAYSFSKSSTRLENWVLSHKTWGPMVINWRKYRSIPLKAKMMAVTGMSLSAFLMFVSPAPFFVKIGCYVVLFLSGVYVVSRPSGEVVSNLNPVIPKNPNV